MYTANMVKQRSYWEWRYAVDILISCHSHLTTEQIFKTKFEQQIIWHFNTLVVSKCVIGVNWRLHKVPPMVFIFGTACQIYCYGRYCVRRSVSSQVPENPSGPLVDNFIVLPCVAFGVACVKLLPGVDRWNSLDDPRVIGPCHCEVWGWPRH